ncbi:MAG TPA: hypothetical protein VF198_09430 [Vicinamibacterales bacterium]
MRPRAPRLPDRLAVCTTAYPGCERFVRPWHDALLAQTDRDFDLWIALDSIGPERIEAAAGRPVAARWVRSRRGDTPASIRARAFDALVDAYDAIVLVDIDDVPLPSRVAAARRALAGADVAGCALRYCDGHGRPLDGVFRPPPRVPLADLLPRCNVFGLSNSAYRSAALARVLPLPADCVLIDWLMASRAAAAGARLAFDRTPRMIYRRYGGNCAPVRPPFTGRSVLTAASLVVRHYALLLDGQWPWSPRRRRPFEAARRRAEMFEHRVRTSAAALRRYVRALNRMPAAQVWWWSIANPELEELWTTSA